MVGAGELQTHRRARYQGCPGCTTTVNGVTGRTANQVFGSPDDVKFRSSMTLFGRADPVEPLFRDALARCFDSQEDPRMLEKLGFS